MPISDGEKAEAILKAVALTTVFKALGWANDKSTRLAMRLLARVGELRPDSLTDEQLWQELEFLSIDEKV